MPTEETLKVLFFDAQTGESIERAITPEELSEHNAMMQADGERQAQAQAKADARQSALAKLADLGLTQDEINAL
jgi:hypothetical protein